MQDEEGQARADRPAINSSDKRAKRVGVKLRIGRGEIDEIIGVGENRPQLARAARDRERRGSPRGSSGRANHCMLFFTKICMAVHSIERARSIAMCTPPPIDMWAPRRISNLDAEFRFTRDDRLCS